MALDCSPITTIRLSENFEESKRNFRDVYQSFLNSSYIASNDAPPYKFDFIENLDEKVSVVKKSKNDFIIGYNPKLFKTFDSLLLFSLPKFPNAIQIQGVSNPEDVRLVVSKLTNHLKRKWAGIIYEKDIVIQQWSKEFEFFAAVSFEEFFYYHMYEFLKGFNPSHFVIEMIKKTKKKFKGSSKYPVIQQKVDVLKKRHASESDVLNFLKNYSHYYDKCDIRKLESYLKGINGILGIKFPSRSRNSSNPYFEIINGDCFYGNMVTFSEFHIC
jgi:hypothetical protein